MLVLFVMLALAFLIVRLAPGLGMPLRMALTPAQHQDPAGPPPRGRAVPGRLRAAGPGAAPASSSISRSLEHRAEIVADKAIADQVEPEVWGEAMAALVDEVKAGRPGAGMAKAVEQVGEVLAEILPPTPATIPTSCPTG